MITLKTLFAIAIFNILAISCDKNEEPQAAPTEQTIAFNPDNYSEFMTCKVGDFQYNTGNSAGNTTSISTLKIGSTLYLNNSDGNFISGNLASMEINMQLKNFTPNVLKSYEVSGTFPTEILKFKHVGGENYDTNNGVNTTPQANSVTITKIENNFYFGTFAFKTFKTTNRGIELQVSEGNFKFKYIP